MTAPLTEDEILAGVAILDRMERGEPPRDESEAASYRSYDRLFETVRNIPSLPPPAGWEDRVRDGIRRRAADDDLDVPTVTRRSRTLRTTEDAMTATPTIGLVVPDVVPHPIDDHLDVPTIVRRARREAMSPVVDLAKRRQAIPTVTDARLTPLAARMINDSISAMCETIGHAPEQAPLIDPLYLDDGRVSIAIVLTGPVASLNERADELLLRGVAPADQPLPVVARPSDEP